MSRIQAVLGVAKWAVAALGLAGCGISFYIDDPQTTPKPAPTPAPTPRPTGKPVPNKAMPPSAATVSGPPHPIFRPSIVPCGASIGMLGLGSHQESTDYVAKHLTSQLRSRLPTCYIQGPERDFFKEVKDRCNDENDPECLAELGRTMGVQYLVSGAIIPKPEPEPLVVYVELLEVKTAAVMSKYVGSLTNADYTAKADDVLSDLRLIATQP